MMHDGSIRAAIMRRTGYDRRATEQGNEQCHRRDHMKTSIAQWGRSLERADRQLSRPSQAWRFARTLGWQAAAARTRRSWQDRGVRVPPIVIFSITHQCNLRCVGCFAQSFLGAREGGGCANAARSGWAAPGKSPAQTSGTERREAGQHRGRSGRVGGLVLCHRRGRAAPAERECSPSPSASPKCSFCSSPTVSCSATRPWTVSPASKNQFLCSASKGTAAQTDERRGQAPYEGLMAAMVRLKKRRQFFGCSLTLTSKNYSSIFADEYVGGLIEAGCGCSFWPTTRRSKWGTRTGCSPVCSRSRCQERVHELGGGTGLSSWPCRGTSRSGGCLSAGRGFVHVNAAGEVEPCPFAPILRCRSHPGFVPGGP